MTSEPEVQRPTDILGMTSDIVAAYVGHNPLPGGELASLIKNVHTALNQLTGDATPMSGTSKPAVTVKKSVTPDYLVCLEDGRKLKMLKRYLRSRYKLTPDEYRRKWGLPPDYPMVASNYAERRSEFAKKIGLGRLPKSKKRKRG